MPRKPAQKVLDSGDCNLRVTIPQPIWVLCGALSVEWGIKPDQALRILIGKFARVIENEGADFLGDDVNRIIRQLLANDRVSLAGLPPIDVAKLHRSDKTRSGFVGVYANGKGFRAMARRSATDATQINLGTRASSEQAAEMRRLHYEREGMAYGEAEDAIQAFRKAHPGYGTDRTDEELLDETNEWLERTLQPPVSLTSKAQGLSVVAPLKAFGFDGDLPTDGE